MFPKSGNTCLLLILYLTNPPNTHPHIHTHTHIHTYTHTHLLSVSSPPSHYPHSPSHTHTHTHTRAYVYLSASSFFSDFLFPSLSINHFLCLSLPSSVPFALSPPSLSLSSLSLSLSPPCSLSL